MPLVLLLVVDFPGPAAPAVTSGLPVQATEIAGTITARRDRAVKIEFEPLAEVGPSMGDRVEFKAEIQDIVVDAGTGEVVEVGGGFVWASVLRGRPTLKHTGVIHATGVPAADPPAAPPTRPNPAPPETSIPGSRVFERPPDSGGVRLYQGEMRQGRYGDVLLKLIRSPEFERRLAR